MFCHRRQERRKVKNLILRSRVFAASRRMRLLGPHGSRRAGVYHRAALAADPLAAPRHEGSQCQAAAAFFSSRSSRRRIFPPLVFGSSVLNSICFVTLSLVRSLPHNSLISPSLPFRPSLTTTPP